MRASKRGIVAAIVSAAVLGFAPGARAADGAVKVAKSEKAGSYLTDDKGMTLYVFKKDSEGKSACAGACVTNWPIYHREKVEPAGGASAADFKTITREDRKKQTTYKGKPLYTFVGDKKPGDTNGQGVMDAWSVAAP
ncbi:COG4315 family predicted lipoprotein [Anaeromyxobacter terrae]|uniref:COG4315 family predicted lipoprotein n=1 Tax=Anaeromyxobacter terrae TaxID=2925406 RepID=UPI001F59DCF4|nr:hypothetical protein [Anaeromyxobacter sp. SG22]